jgi:acetyl/propionyl-CoA carboxylase alpha subunit
VNWIEVTVQGRKIRVAVVHAGEGAWVGWEGQSRYLKPERAGSSAPAVTEREIRAPMTGRVVSVGVSSGSRVRAKEVLLVLEAMKMEYRLSAPRDGIVESVRCGAGDKVHLDQVLVTLAP